MLQPGRRETELYREIIDPTGSDDEVHYCNVTFLPSRFGSGFRASISGRLDDYVNWRDCGYDALRGVAQDPTSEDTSNGEWLKFVRSNLKAQGVSFVTLPSASSTDPWSVTACRLLELPIEEREQRLRQMAERMDPEVLESVKSCMAMIALYGPDEPHRLLVERSRSDARTTH